MEKRNEDHGNGQVEQLVKPRRIQRKRTRGWKMPPNTIYVGRPSVWGNCFDYRDYGRAEAVERFEKVIDKATHGAYLHTDTIRHLLKGKNLACWCSIGEPCHADILLKIANGA